MQQPAGDYALEVAVQAPPERMFRALTTLDGLASWWTPIVGGTPTAGGQIQLGFPGLDEQIVLRVDVAAVPSTVTWTCLTHTGHSEWRNTTITFELFEHGRHSCLLRFRHIGLGPALDCYLTCRRGWDHFLASLVGHAERGQGHPFPERSRG
jgi:uncharacterized protein YndB with AHSA1/START domain